MKKACAVIVLVAVLFVVGPANADQVKVNIVYPIDGASYPITDPAPGGLKSAYIPASFSVTCEADHKVNWGFDDVTKPLGNTVFYDQISMQFVYKLPGGVHVFWVVSDCGKNQVKFTIGQ